MIKYLSLLFIFFFSLTLKAQDNDKLEWELQRALENENLKGAVWSMLSDNKITMGAVGLKDVGLGEKLTVKNKVQIGSITKTLIATGILRLASQGKLAIDSPVNKLLTDLSFDNPWEKTNQVTIRHLLNHTSGLEDARFWQIFSKKPTPYTPLESVFKKNPSVLKIRTKPGKRFSYSNMGYCMLGLIIERVTGEPYEEYLDANLLKPLGMNNSTFQFLSQEGTYTDPALAMGHFDDGTTQKNLPMYLRPAGQFSTTAGDMALFAKFLMSDGLIDGKIFVEKRLLNQMGKPTSTEANENGLSSGYQFGLSYRDRYGVVGYFHRGNIIGYRATFYLFPEQNKAFFISFNTDSETADYQMFNAIFINQLGIEKPKKEIPTVNLPLNIEEFEGYYRLKPIRFQMFAYAELLFNSIKVIQTNNTLTIQSLQNDSYELLPLSENLFKKQDRVKASHVLYELEDTKILSDGLKTYEKISPFYLITMWISLILGSLGILIILIKGLLLFLRKKLFESKQVITIPFLSIVSLFITIPFLVNQSFLEIGDLTFTNASMALVSGILPFAMIIGLIKSWQNKVIKKVLTIDLIGMLFALQWTIILVIWGVIPFMLWI
ncbi:serine hydrolase domain-containing protein [Xanthovirga aplysinae]|uniref:serine hydrolase domain-containing protein n=1 Tax=Xanthovirga aplysinae TaxID=2529853 RepID=UPI0012BD0E41|nr:serine hydrolase domain-containing protein [Xanthovirga aplysinae]MTI30477.1 class C beta-lactamase-related serine hydrolase [Xanthovirga aplysinae]